MDKDLRIGFLITVCAALAFIVIIIIALATVGCQTTPANDRPVVISPSPAPPGGIVTDVEKQAAADVAATGKDIAVRIEGAGTLAHSENGKTNLTCWRWIGDWIGMAGTVTELNKLQAKMQSALAESQAILESYNRAQAEREAQIANLFAEFGKKVEVIEGLNVALKQEKENADALQARLDLAEARAAPKTWRIWGIVGAVLAAAIAFVWLRFGETFGVLLGGAGVLTWLGTGMAIFWRLYSEYVIPGLYIAGAALVVGLVAAGITWAIRRKQLINVVQSVQRAREILASPKVPNVEATPLELVDDALSQTQTPDTKALVKAIRYETGLDTVHK